METNDKEKRLTVEIAKDITQNHILIAEERQQLAHAYLDLLKQQERYVVIGIDPAKGYALVPVEPTEEMFKAALQQDPYLLDVPGMCKMRLELFYTSMVSPKEGQ